MLLISESSLASLTHWQLHTLKIVAVSLLSVVWTRYVVGRQKVGLPRLALAAPVLLVYQYCSFSYQPYKEALSGAYTFGFLGWVAAFKVAAFCFNRGPLTRTEFGLWQQFPIQLLPIYPTDESAAVGRLAENGTTLTKIAVRVPLKAAVLRILLQLLKDKRYPDMFVVFQSVAMFCYVSMILDLLVLTTRVVFGLHICPAFDQPWKAVSLAEFWSRRWNIAISHLLRQTIYDPIVDGRFTKPLIPSLKPPSRVRKDLGVFAVFLVSGIMHEAFQYAMNRTALGLMLIFFAGQAPLMILERHLLQFANQRNLMPAPWIRNVITISVLLAFGSCTFWPSVTSTGLTDKVVQVQLDSFGWVDKTLLMAYGKIVALIGAM